MTPEDPPTDDEKEGEAPEEYSGEIEIPNLSEENDPEDIDVSLPHGVVVFVTVILAIIGFGEGNVQYACQCVRDYIGKPSWYTSL